MQKREITKFQKTIWDFYHAHKRAMPWRGEKDPYKVLVSEVMLQQTQVSRVLEKYPEFITSFPSVESLAKSSFSEVLRVWQGLGYNRRAKFLYQCAQVVVKKHKGIFPRDYETLLSLPGVGKGTAGSFLSFAYNIPVAFIETNIRRVYIHHFFQDTEKISDTDILPLVNQTLDRTNPREWYYALMDYGAHLKSIVSNPNVKSTHYTKQSIFKGSNREVRGAILRFLLNTSRIQEHNLQKHLSFSQSRIETALETLVKEGIVIRKGLYIYLPNHVI